MGVTVAAFFVMWGAFMYMSASGNPRQMEAGKSAIVNALAGLAIVLLARVIAARLETPPAEAGEAASWEGMWQTPGWGLPAALGPPSITRRRPRLAADAASLLGASAPLSFFAAMDRLSRRLPLSTVPLTPLFVDRRVPSWTTR